MFIHGYWSPVTSNVDWCEDNYIISYYIAEWYNSVSNLIPIFYPIYTLYKSNYILKDNNKIYNLCHILLICVFTGSFCFHATLTKCGQLLDELPMLITNIFLLYILDNFNNINLLHNTIIKIIILYFIYLFPNSHLPFRLSFVYYNYKLFNKIYKLIKKNNKLLQNTKIKYSIFYYTIGLICWLIDIYLCNYIKYFYLHSLWHIFSYIGCLSLLNFIFIYLSNINPKYKLPLYYKNNIIH